MLLAKPLLLGLLCSVLPTSLLAVEEKKPVMASYFAEWGIYGRDFPVAKIPAQDLTHVLYGFIAICGPNQSLARDNPEGYQALVRECQDQEDYTLTIHDRWAALDKAYPGDKWDDAIKGNFGELIRLKKKFPELKVLPSIGGWTLSDPFYELSSKPELRKRFVQSSIEFLKAYPFFDGLDIDWEYPSGGGANEALGARVDGQNYALLMKELKVALNSLEGETGRKFELTSAIGADPQKIAAVNYEEAAKALDYIFVMSYDFYGAWNGTLGHHAGLYPSKVGSIEGFTGSNAIENLTKAGVPKNKLVLGYAMYGRAWKGVQGSTPTEPFLGQGQGALSGTWEAGVLDYKDIAKRYYDEAKDLGKGGFSYGYDSLAEAPYLYDAKAGSLITFENKRSVKAKADFARQEGLAGLFSWEIDADNGTLLNAAKGISQNANKP